MVSTSQKDSYLKKFEADSEMERQKIIDLERAQARSVSRPIKKDGRFAKIEGRYIRPEELEKEVEKLNFAKQEAAKKRRGFFARLFDKDETQAEDVSDKEENLKIKKAPKKEISDKLKNKVAKIQKLRGISDADQIHTDIGQNEASLTGNDLFWAKRFFSKASESETDPSQKLKSFDRLIEKTSETLQSVYSRSGRASRPDQSASGIMQENYAQSGHAGQPRQSASGIMQETYAQSGRASRPDQSASGIMQENYAQSGYTGQPRQSASGIMRETYAQSGRASRPDQSASGIMQENYAQSGQDIPENTEKQFSDLSRDLEAAKTLFAPVQTGEKEGLIASALSVAVGFIYFEETGDIVDRIITIRRLFSKGGDILIDAFCHDISMPRVIAFSKGIRLYNLRTMSAYENPRDFLLYQLAGISGTKQKDSSGFADALSVVRYDLAALAFAAGSDFNKSHQENDLLLAYVTQRCPTICFDEKEMLNYITMLVPDEQSFFEAIEIIVKQPQEIVYLFVHTFLQLLLSDGVLHQNERELLAELLYLLKIEGIDLGRLGLE